MAGNRTNPEATLRQAVSILVEATQVLGIPILRSVISLQRGVVPETIKELRGEPPIVRSMVGVFDHEGSRQVFEAHGRSVIAIGGISSQIAVLHAVLGARRSGHAVHVLVDACGGLGKRTERAAFNQMEAAGATMSSVASFLTGMTPSLKDSRTQAVFGSLSPLWT